MLKQHTSLILDTGKNVRLHLINNWGDTEPHRSIGHYNNNKFLIVEKIKMLNSATCTENRKNPKITFFFHNSRENRKELFKSALAAAKDGKVLYILREELKELPELSQDIISINRHYIKMISFLYTNNLESLIENISSLPDWQNVPVTIILDGLDEYCSKETFQNACAVLGLLVDTANSCSKMFNTKPNLLISINRDVIGDDYCNLIQELYCCS